MKNKEITMYELIGLIKDNKAPKKIKIDNNIWFFYTITKSYIDNETDYVKSLSINFNYYIENNKLNDTVEILSEENDEWENIWELLNNSRYNFSDRQNGMTQEDRRLLDSNFKTLVETINKIIKNQKHLKERLDNVKDDVVFDYWKDKVVGKDE